MTYTKPYRTATHDRAVAALQALLKEEGPAQVYHACGDAMGDLRQALPLSVLHGTSTETPMLVTVTEAAKRIGVGRSVLYPHVMSGTLPSVVIGARERMIVASAIPGFIAWLWEEQRVLLTQNF